MVEATGILDGVAPIKRTNAALALIQHIHVTLWEWVDTRVGWHNNDVADELIGQVCLRVLAGALSPPQRQHRQHALSYRSDSQNLDDFDAAIRMLAEAELPRLLRAVRYRNGISKQPVVRLSSTRSLTTNFSDPPASQTRIHFDSEDKGAIIQALTKLPVRYREIVHLRYLEGCDFAELVHELGSAAPIVGLRLCRATKILIELTPLTKPRAWSGERDPWSRPERRRWLRELWIEARARDRHASPPLPLVRVAPGLSLTSLVRKHSIGAILSRMARGRLPNRCV